MDEQGIKDAEKYLGLTKEQEAAYKSAGEAAAETILRQSDASKGLKQFEENIKNLKNNISGLSTGIVQTMGGLASLGSALKSLSSLRNTWDPENDISAFERLTSTMTTLGFALPQLINGFKSLKEGLGAISAATGIAGGWIVALVAAVGGLIYLMWE